MRTDLTSRYMHMTHPLMIPAGGPALPPDELSEDTELVEQTLSARSSEPKPTLQPPVPIQPTREGLPTSTSERLLAASRWNDHPRPLSRNTLPRIGLPLELPAQVSPSVKRIETLLQGIGLLILLGVIGAAFFMAMT